MGDLRTYFGAVIITVFSIVFCATMFSFAMSNGNYQDTGQFPISNETNQYIGKLYNNSASFSQSTSNTFNQNPYISAYNSIVSGLTAGITSFSIIFDSIILMHNIVMGLFLSPIFGLLMIPDFVKPLAITFIDGTALLIISAVVLKWFV